MEPAFQSHPVPQNVTNFEFHLVGDMTLKQFGYLAAGLGSAYITFLAAAVPAPFVAWPLIVIFALTGAAFAFLPIQERPLDHWVGAFFKAIAKPTKLRYKSQILSEDDPFFKTRLNIYLRSLAQQVLNNPSALPSKSAVQARVEAAKAIYGRFSNSVSPDATPAAVAQVAPSSTLSAPAAFKTTPPQAATNSTPKPEDLKKSVELAKDAQATQTQILEVEQQLNQIKANAAQPGADAKKYVDEFQKLLGDLQKLNEHASETAKELTVLSNIPPTQLPTSTIPVIKAKSISNITLTTFPNIVNGIVTDSGGNYVEQAIVVAHDHQGLPVRALKTNKLGQFIAATPLPNGTYTIAVEKENLSFDVVQLELTGEISKPVIITAKPVGPLAVS